MKKVVYFFKSGDLPQDFISSLSSSFSLYPVSVLSFSFTKFESNLLSTDFDSFDCIVFPSQRSVEAVHRLSINLSHKRLCAVGESTALSIKSLLAADPWITGSQGAKELASQIISSDSVRSLAYLSGDNQATLPFEELKNAGIEVNEITCYGTEEITREELEKLVENLPFPDICVFFSPSGVRTVFSKLNWNWAEVKHDPSSFIRKYREMRRDAGDV